MSGGYVSGRLLIQLQHETAAANGGADDAASASKSSRSTSKRPRPPPSSPSVRHQRHHHHRRTKMDDAVNDDDDGFVRKQSSAVTASHSPEQKSTAPTTRTHHGDSANRHVPATAEADTMDARAIQIVQMPEPHTFVLDEEALGDILLQDHLKDRFVCVVSVAGAFRKGKSFLLDFFLRYMYAKYHHHNVKSASIGGSSSSSSTDATASAAAVPVDESWLGGDEVPLSGFSWRGGSERETTGILMWSDIFVHDYANGHKIAVMLLDTQGTFDSQSTVRDCATVFALSTMLSSVQIFNLSQNIQEDDLQHLHLFTEYGRLALAESGVKPFQRLQFLVRDWSYPYEAEYGPVGGQKLLQKRLEISEHQHPELQSLRQHIASCFEEIACFLMPHPGLSVATSPTFDGRLADIDAGFKQSLRALVPMLLAPENLIVKQIGGQKVRVREMIQYFKSYIAIYQGNELPEPKSMLQATAEANNLTAMSAAKELYGTLMEEVCGGVRPYLSAGHLEAEHMRIKEKSLNAFSSTRKMGGEEYSAQYLQQLEAYVEEQFVNFRAHNESKNIFKAARTPTVFFCIAIVMYILSGLFGLFGMYTFANFSNLVMGLALLTLATWGYIRYSGEFSDFGCQIDWLASLVWENFLKPIYEGCVEKGVQHVAIQATQAAIGTNAGAPTRTTGGQRSHANGGFKRS